MHYPTLCAIGWRKRYTQAIQSANENAELWAQSELQRVEVELEAARLSGLCEFWEKSYSHMAGFAEKAIRLRVAEEGLNVDEAFADVLDADHIE